MCKIMFQVSALFVTYLLVLLQFQLNDKSTDDTRGTKLRQMFVIAIQMGKSLFS